MATPLSVRSTPRPKTFRRCSAFVGHPCKKLQESTMVNVASVTSAAATRAERLSRGSVAPIAPPRPRPARYRVLLPALALWLCMGCAERAGTRAEQDGRIRAAIRMLFSANIVESVTAENELLSIGKDAYPALQDALGRVLTAQVEARNAVTTAAVTTGEAGPIDRAARLSLLADRIRSMLRQLSGAAAPGTRGRESTTITIPSR